MQGKRRRRISCELSPWFFVVGSVEMKIAEEADEAVFAREYEHRS